MALSAGTHVGPYEIVALIGAGGMGEVYRAKDTKLNRDVALKVLPELLAGDPDRLARFRREAQLLASLNHPNIAHLYGFEETEATAAGPGGAAHALVMELVEGPTLAELAGQRAALKTDDALRIARQIAEALEAAHEQGIVHRDLKPANVKVRGDGTVKVLDFGLAKALEPSGAASAEAMNSPTLTARATQLGVILGTAAYMAPEQAKGKIVDRRADIWAFGVVVYEMLTGRRAFDAEDVSDTLAAVLTREIDWTALPADVPARLRALLRDCLIRDPRQRLRDIGDARIAIDRILGGAPDSSLTPASAVVVAPARRVLPWMAGLFAAVTLASAATWAVVHEAPEPPAQPVRFAIAPPPAQGIVLTATDRALAISPDGTHVAYVATGGSLVVRAIDRIDTETLPGITGVRSPFFSPDGKWLGFFQGTTEIRKVSITGGPSLPVCKITAASHGASWGPNDTIVFSMGNNGLFTVSGGGGDPKMITKSDFAHGEFGHYFPAVLPGGQALLFTINAAPGQPSHDADQIAVLDLKTGKQKTLLRGGSQAEYVFPGYLVYAAAGALRAVRFDLERLEVQGDAVPVQAQVATSTLGTAEFSISRTGSLVYLPGSFAGSTARSLVWIDRKGREELIKAPPRAYYALRLSPDGTRLAIDIRDQDKNNDIWVWDLDRETSTRITVDPGVDSFPVWTTDSRRIVYSSMHGGASPNLFWQAADGTGSAERLTTADHVQFAMSFSPDGGSLLVKEQNAGTADDISILSMTGKREVASLIHTSFNERNAEVSPDGHWLAYESDESTLGQIYVQPFPQVNNGGRVQISTNGGWKPMWAPNGRELFYFNDNALYGVAVHTTPSFSLGKPVKLFDARLTWQLVSGRFYDISRDGQRFVVIKDPRPTNQAAAEAQGLVVVVNWVEELKAKVK
jgi:eukaryotic-like serine/threonine-protein kinase